MPSPSSSMPARYPAMPHSPYAMPPGYTPFSSPSSLSSTHLGGRAATVGYGVNSDYQSHNLSQLSNVNSVKVDGPLNTYSGLDYHEWMMNEKNDVDFTTIKGQKVMTPDGPGVMDVLIDRDFMLPITIITTTSTDPNGKPMTIEKTSSLIRINGEINSRVVTKTTYSDGSENVTESIEEAPELSYYVSVMEQTKLTLKANQQQHEQLMKEREEARANMDRRNSLLSGPGATAVGAVGYVGLRFLGVAGAIGVRALIN